MYKIISLDHSLKEIFSSPFAFSSAVNDEYHLKIGKICDEIGFVDLAFAHYSAVINNKKADKISLQSSKLLLAEIKKNHPLIGKNIKVETINLVEKKTILSRLSEVIISEFLKIAAISIVAIVASWSYFIN